VIDLEPGVQLTSSTAAAMERLSTSPLKPAMTEIEELRARVEWLEATQHAHIDTSHLSKEERDQILQELAKPARVFATAEATQQRPPHQDKLDRLIALDAADDGEPIVMPSPPAGSLVERVADAIGAADDEAMTWSDYSRAAILEVAARLREQALYSASFQIAADLEHEANR
jgi:hypothetical protein